MHDYQQYMAESRRLAVLSFLATAQQCTAHDVAVKKHLNDSKLTASMDIVRSDLQWLYEQQLLRLDKVDTVLVATLTARGDDVRLGLSKVPGVAVPELS